MRRRVCKHGFKFHPLGYELPLCGCAYLHAADRLPLWRRVLARIIGRFGL
jgi:hypothetical protein